MSAIWLEKPLRSLSKLKSSELHAILSKNDRATWSDEAFEAIQQILRYRGEEVPPHRLGLAAGYASVEPGLPLGNRILIFLGGWVLLLPAPGAIVVLTLSAYSSWPSFDDTSVFLTFPITWVLTSIPPLILCVLWPRRSEPVRRKVFLVMLWLGSPLVIMFLLSLLSLLAYQVLYDAMAVYRK